jgi:hypothetical protein
MRNIFTTSFLFRLPILAFLFLTISLSGCVSHYVDNATPEIPVDQFTTPQLVKPVQLLFEFQTNGVVNAFATKLLKDYVADQIKLSGLFSEVGFSAVEGGNILSVILNNVSVDGEDAFAKGFAAGFTFGLASSQVTDGYICTAKYISNSQPEAINIEARHAIHTMVGAGEEPINSTKANNVDEAVSLMLKQILSHVLNDLSNNEKFN